MTTTITAAEEENPSGGEEEKGEGRDEWDCDTFFPSGVLPSVDERTTGSSEVGGGGGGTGWERRSMAELREWTGEEDVGGVRREDVKEEGKEGVVEFEMEMWEKRRE